MQSDWYVANINSVTLLVWIAFVIGTLFGASIVAWLK